jgi:teichuronic acid exporter
MGSAVMTLAVPNQFLTNLGWLGAAQILNRVFRLATTVVLARWLSPQDYGLAAIVLTTNEFVNVFTRSGIGARLIQAKETDLDRLCNTAYWLNWLLCIGLFLVQCAVAFPLGWLYGQAIVLPICAMASIYLMLPFALVQTALIARENRLHIFATISVTQFLADCVMTIGFVLCGFGLWAIILPKILATPIWTVINLKNHNWQPPKSWTLDGWQEIVHFGRSILGVELLATLRGNIDYLLVGYFLGVKVLGIYYFAFNAGLGISMSVINAFSSALFPHLCASEAAERPERFLKSMRTVAFVLIPLVTLQASLAPIYVPIVFGQKWVVSGAVPILIWVCLSALPRPFAEAASQLLRAENRPDLDLRWNLYFTFFLIVGLLVGTHWGILGVAVALCGIHCLCLPFFTVWTYRFLFTPSVQPCLKSP